MIRVTDLSGGYGGRRVLTDVSLTVRDGETVAVLGANTAGKTTLIRAICGQLPVVSGSIRFDDVELVGVPAHRRVAAGIAVVPEGRHVFPAMSVEDNLLVGAYHRRRVQLGPDLERCFALFPRLRERRRQKAASMSGGEQQMVAIGRALMARPRLLVLDEPGHGLAPLMVEEVHAAIRQINASGVSVLLVEQNVASALQLVGRAYVVENGRITLSGTAGELAGNDEVRRSYLGI
jgi:branched-chain amino acid transport system ATP-binding protein